ncbi:MAG: hypothetical protein AB7S78_13035 [Candidatus Omnitrophota bacterium]
MSQRKFLNLVYAGILTSAGVVAALNAAELTVFVCQQGAEYHGQKILETRTIVRQKADELMYRLNNDPAAQEQTLRQKLLRQFVVACEQVPPFDQPRRGYCNQNSRVYRHFDCIRRVRLNQLTDQELYDFLAEKFQTNIIVYGDFKKAMDLRVKDLYHVHQYYRYKSGAEVNPESREHYRRTHRLMKDVYQKEKEWLKAYYKRSLTIDAYKKLVIDLKISAMKQTPDWAQGKWKSYIVPKK